MSKFKVGDKVKVVDNCCSHAYVIGQEDIITSISGSEIYLGTSHGYTRESDLKLINNKTMNLKEKFITAFLSEPEKSYRKAGITNGDGVFTAEGQEIFLTYLLKKDNGLFKTEVVDVLLAEDKKAD